MNIFSIDLKNFRQYRGEKRIDFSTDGKFTIIQGGNGSGKTNLLNAITWCLYGKEFHLSNTSLEHSVEPVNKKTIQETKVNGDIEMKVRIRLGDSTPEYIIQRTRRGYKLSENQVSYDEKDEFKVYKMVNGDPKPISEQPNYFINLLLPENIHEFFFFDGEKLDDFFKVNSRQSIHDSILDVAQIGLLDKTLEHLDNVGDDIRRDKKKLSPNAEAISERIDSLKVGLDTAKQQLLVLRQEETDLTNKIKDIDLKLKKSSFVDAQQLHQERVDLETNEKILDTKRKEALKKNIDHLVRTAPFIYVEEAFSYTMGLIDEKYKKGDLPPKIREPFLMELLLSGECICGTDISNDSPQRAKVELLLRRAQISRIDQAVTTGKFKISTILDEISKFSKLRQNSGMEISKMENEINKNQQRRKEISTQLKNIDVEEIGRLESNRGILNGQLRDKIAEVGGKKTDVDNTEAYLTQQRSEYTKELKKSQQYTVLKKQLDLCEDSASAINTIKEQLVSQVRMTVQNKTKEYFLSLIWKKSTFENVRISDNYDISVIHQGGWDALGVLSAGERQILALSFMAALREAAGVWAPVIIDTLLGRISREPRENIAELLPKYMKDSQVTLLVTDEEYTPFIRSKLASWVGKEYRLVFNEQNQETTVDLYGS